jgi:hypothetical protein
LTIVRAYVVAGFPHTERKLESFEEWTRLACDPLRWLGMADTIDTQELEADDECDALAAAFTVLADTMPERFKARDVHLYLAGFNSRADELQEALLAAAKSGGVALWRLLRAGIVRDHRDDPPRFPKDGNPSTK